MFSLLSFIDTHTSLADPHARIHEAVAKVRNQVAEQADKGIDNLHKRDEVIVGVLDSVKEQKSHAFEAEHSLHNHSTGDNAEEAADKNRHQRNQCIAPSVRVNHDLLPQALGTGGADAVKAQSIDHGSTGNTRNGGERTKGQADAGQRHMVKNIQRVLPSGGGTAGCFHARNREPSQNGTEEDNKQNVDDKYKKSKNKEKEIKTQSCNNTEKIFKKKVKTEYQEVYDLIFDGINSMDELYKKTGLKVKDINNMLFMLELEGNIIKTSGGYKCI